ncbi:MAG: serine hydrolase, partial [Defluviitaleaceae bacterium]|nr:serine hydrolase [Defluviitaleaceae bacterium]
MRKKALSAALALLMIAGNAIDVNGGLNANPSNARLNLSSITAVVMCFYTGEVLYGRNHDVMRSPASMTKMMTVYLVLEAIENGQIALDTRVPISAQTAEMSRNPGETNVILTTSGHYTVEQLMDLAIVMSASAASVALGELVGGSRMAFRDLMNGKANEWGIDARFWYAHASGPNNPMSARAMATITRNTFLRFPDIAQRTTIPSIYFGGRIWRSTNKLLGVYYGAD